jgi:hypothetical protein
MSSPEVRSKDFEYSSVSQEDTGTTTPESPEHNYNVV